MSRLPNVRVPDLAHSTERRSPAPVNVLPFLWVGFEVSLIGAKRECSAKVLSYFAPLAFTRASVGARRPGSWHEMHA